MAGMVIVSHSMKLADGVKELICQMGIISIPIEAAGGTNDGSLGTDSVKIESAIKKVISSGEVLIFYDIGSSLINTEMAIENIPVNNRELVHIIHAPIVEGAFIAAVDLSVGKGIEEIKYELKSMKSDKSSW